jgi:hypothetical protein
METRSQTEIYLLGSSITDLLGAKLPSNRQVFGLLLHLHLIEKLSIRNAARQVIRDVLQYWDRARIPTRDEQHCISKLEEIHNRWTVLKKHKNRKTLLHRQQETDFIDNLEDLFDVAHANALNMITIPADRDFLTAQRQKGRVGVMGPVDRALAARERRAKEAADREQKKRLKAKTQVEQMAIAIISFSTSEDDTDDESSEDALEGSPAPKRSCRLRRATKNIMTPGLAAALDRTGISSRQATFVLAEAAKSLGHDVADVNINRMSVHRQRKQQRVQFVKDFKNKFPVDVTVVIHWDGKLMEDLTSNQHIDRLPVIATGEGISQLLGVPKIASGTGEAQAVAVKRLLDEWNLSDRVGALCFDTTASNTGKKVGACVLLEKKLQRNVLHLACRHHIIELLMGSAFEQTVGGSSGPAIQLFKRFREQWHNINKESFSAGPTDVDAWNAVADVRDEIVEFAKSQLKDKQPRDDYCELLELSIIFLGEIPSRGVRIMAPGAMHHARWIAKVLYALKIWMFRQQFKLTAREEAALRDLAIFAVRVYVKAWITAPSAICAPFNDLQLINSLLQYSAINQAISTATTKKLSTHLWYLSEELVALSLFDDRVFSSTKRLMVAAMQKKGTDKPSKRREIDLQNIYSCTLDQFATSNSMNLFHCLKLPTEFLSTDPDTWKSLDSYGVAKRRLATLKVVNDTAERGVSLIQDYNRTLTKDEEDLQFLLQVVSDHRQLHPTSKKTEL